MNPRQYLLSSVLALSAVTSMAADYPVGVTRVAQDLYSLRNYPDVLVHTQSCFKRVTDLSALLVIDNYSGVHDGELSFSGGGSCVVQGVYNVVTLNPQTSGFSLTPLDGGYYLDVYKHLLVKGGSNCSSALFNEAASVSFTTTGKTYQGGLPIGTLSFNGIQQSSCELIGYYVLSNWTKLSPIPAKAVLSDVALANVSAGKVVFQATTEKVANLYWEILPASDPAPNTTLVRAGLDSNKLLATHFGSVPDVLGVSSVEALGLSAGTNYKAYLTANYGIGPYADLVVIPFTTPAATKAAPKLLGATFKGTYANGATLTVTGDQNATLYWEVLRSSAAAPKVKQIVKAVDGADKPSLLKGYGPIAAGQAANFAMAGLTPGISYRVYMAAVDDAGQYSNGLYLDLTPPAGVGAGKPAIKPQTGWWWNPSEGGRGYSLETNAQGLVYFAGFMYDAQGSPVWYLAQLTPGADGAYSGDLQYYQNGQGLREYYRAPAAPMYVGKASLIVQSPSSATLAISGPGVQPRSINIERFPIVANGLAQPAQAGGPETGWWWNPNEGGRGYFIETQGKTAFMSAYTYDRLGKPTWYVTQGNVDTGTGYLGQWGQYADGQTLFGNYVSPVTASEYDEDTTGSVQIQFRSPRSATLTLPNGWKIPIERFSF